jgi:mannonate dehydratase
MMANLAIDLSCSSFGIQEYAREVFDPAVTGPDPNNHNDEVFPGFEQHRLENGMMWPSDLPGLGIDIDEAAAAKYPWPTDKGLTGQGRDHAVEWTTVRTKDGSITKP